MGLGTWFVTGVFSAMGKMFAGSFNLLRGAVGHMKGKRSLRLLDKYNQTEKGVMTLRNAVTAAELAGSLPSNGSVLISGNDQNTDADGSWKNVLAVGLAQAARSQGYHIVFLHNGNMDLTGRLMSAFMDNQLLFLEESNQIYDPLRGYSIDECVSVLMRDGVEKFTGSEAAQKYLEGVIQMFEWGYGTRPYLQAIQVILEKNHGFLVNLAMSWLGSNKLTQEQYDVIDANLTGGLSGQYKLKTYLKDLIWQFSGSCVKTKLPDEAMYSLKRASDQNRIAVMDMSSVTNPEMALGLITNELSHLIFSGRKVMLFTDEQAVTKCEALLNMIRTVNSKFRWCIMSRDFYAQCNGDANLFASLVGKSACNVVMCHENGISAQGWQNQLGTYTKKDVSTSWQTGKMRNSPTILFAGTSSGEGYSVSDKLDYKVKAEEIQDLSPGNAFIQRKGAEAIEKVYFSEA